MDGVAVWTVWCGRCGRWEAYAGVAVWQCNERTDDVAVQRTDLILVILGGAEQRVHVVDQIEAHVKQREVVVVRTERPLQLGADL